MTLPEALALPCGREAYELHRSLCHAAGISPARIRASGVERDALRLAELSARQRVREAVDAIRAAQSETLPDGVKLLGELGGL